MMERIRAIATAWAERMAPYVEDDNEWYRVREMDGKDAAALGEEMLEILAVLDAPPAEPTEAEIEAALQAYWNTRDSQGDGDYETVEGVTEQMRAALIAARQAQP